MKNTFKFLGLAVIALVMSFTTFHEKKIVVIDAGHGGKDHGATFEDHTEKTIADAISKKILALNNTGNVKIVLLRNSDEFKTLEERLDAINNLNPDLVISLHVNQNPNTTVKGIEAFVSEDNIKYDISKAFATELLESLSEERLENRGVKNAPFMILRKSNSPAITLELGFLSNEEDRHYITSEDGQDEIASRIYKYVSK